MQPHEQRVKDEKMDLDIKIGKLTAFKSSDTWKTLSSTEQWFLNEQLTVMNRYSEILEQRIVLFRQK